MALEKDPAGHGEQSASDDRDAPASPDTDRQGYDTYDIPMLANSLDTKLLLLLLWMSNDIVHLTRSACNRLPPLA